MLEYCGKLSSVCNVNIKQFPRLRCITHEKDSDESSHWFVLLVKNFSWLFTLFESTRVLSCTYGKLLIFHKNTRDRKCTSGISVIQYHTIMHSEMSSYVYYLTRPITTTVETSFTAEIPAILNLVRQCTSCPGATDLGSRL